MSFEAPRPAPVASSLTADVEMLKAAVSALQSEMKELKAKLGE
jgi:hypothetical protein